MTRMTLVVVMLMDRWTMNRVLKMKTTIGIHLEISKKSIRHRSLQNLPAIKWMLMKCPTWNDAPSETDAQRLFEEPTRIPFTKGAARAISYESYSEAVGAQPTTSYPKFASRVDWEVARWAKLRGPSVMAFDELLKIEDVCRVMA